MKIVVALLVVGLGPVAHAAPTATFVAKKDRDRADKSAAPRAAAGIRVKELVNIRNTWTDETLALDVNGAPPDEPIVDAFLRCHFTNEAMPMDGKLVKALLAAAKHFHAPHIEIVSGFRHPKYNLVLRKKGHEVARDSQHTHGAAVDFRIPGVSTEALRDWAHGYHMGGVGYYRTSGFVHMDTGKIRSWNGD